MLSILGFKPSCPIELEERVWLERRMCWLRDRLGHDRLRSVVLRIPDANDFPELEQLGDIDVEALFRRIVGMMEVRQEVKLEVVQDDPFSFSAGQYESIEGVGIIRVKESLLSDSLRLIAVLAHELSHAILLGEEHLEATEPDMEPLTDLATVFLGFGIFAANASLQERNYSAMRMSCGRIGMAVKVDLMPARIPRLFLRSVET